MRGKNIKIKKQEETENGWRFSVGVGEMDYSVTVDKDYWEKLAPLKKPAELVTKSFEFLLQREPKESILREFNLKVISTYFPEYEEEIRKLLLK